MSDKIKKIIEVIKNQREILGLSLQDLSEKTEISKATLQRYENGITDIPLEKFKIICKALKLSPSSLFVNPSDFLEYNEQLWIARNSKKLTKDEALKLKKLMQVTFDNIDFDKE